MVCGGLKRFHKHSLQRWGENWGEYVEVGSASVNTAGMLFARATSVMPRLSLGISNHPIFLVRYSASLRRY